MGGLRKILRIFEEKAQRSRKGASWTEFIQVCFWLLLEFLPIFFMCSFLNTLILLIVVDGKGHKLLCWGQFLIFTILSFAFCSLWFSCWFRNIVCISMNATMTNLLVCWIWIFLLLLSSQIHSWVWCLLIKYLFFMLASPFQSPLIRNMKCGSS